MEGGEFGRIGGVGQRLGLHRSCSEQARQRSSFTGGGVRPVASMARIAFAVVSTAVRNSRVIGTIRRRFELA